MRPSSETLVLVSGFGPFEKVGTNPSGEIARALADSPPAGVRVRAAVLPVSFARAPEEWDAALAELVRQGERPGLVLSLGVAKRPGFRLERFAKPELKHVPRVDVDGMSAHEFSRPGPPLESGLDLARLLEALRRRGVEDVRISRTAGGYVCERIYHHVLTRARQHGVAGLFVHVPPLRFAALERQVQVVRWVLEEAVALARAATDPLESSRPPTRPRRPRPAADSR
jgi:pyrrolidone-carboxylate peptidase